MLTLTVLIPSAPSSFFCVSLILGSHVAAAMEDDHMLMRELEVKQKVDALVELLDDDEGSMEELRSHPE